ncbi:glycosyl hydrolase family 18 protein [Bacillus stratosphericus]|uniref:glycosyl hydrolase family 18 protein n=1 Tax=Bacillus stratosphericus TaxID=293386 RepID=UPI001CFB45E7|nr:glycosyl hydrolase family 18 protein [Bacillus stratosphericus]
MLFSLSFFNGESAKASSDKSYKMIGYYPSWGAYGRNFQVWDMNVSKVSHINYAFADICWEGRHGNPDPIGPNPQTWSCQDENGVIDVPNGSIVMGDPWIDAQKSNPGDTWDEPIRGNFKQLLKLKKNHPHLKTFISVGGWTWSNRFSDVAANPAARENFAASAVDFLRKYGFDGVDLDWEYPVSGGLPGNSTRPDDKRNYTLLLQDVREKLDVAEAKDGKKYLLTIASGASPEYVSNTELNKIAKTVDWINIMTYDFNGGWQNISAHNAPLFYDPKAKETGVPNAETFNIESTVKRYKEAGVKADKLVLGTPFYGRGWSGCESADDGEYQKCGPANEGTWEKGVFDFSDLEKNYINKNGYKKYWNDRAKVPYLYNAENGNFITYDDEKSYGYKTDFIQSNGLSGAMFWDFSGDSNQTLLNKLAADLGFAPGGGNPEPPSSVPSNLRVTEKTATSISLAWDAPSDGANIAEYVLSYGGGSVSVKETSATIGKLKPNTTYSFTVSAKDMDGKLHTGPTIEAATNSDQTCGYNEWKDTAVYTSGDRVVFNGKVYEAKWWTKGEQPDQAGELGVWKLIGDCKKSV